MRVTVAQVSLPMYGELANGDRALCRSDGSRTMIAVIDGLGHGPEAANASKAGMSSLEEAPLDAPLIETMQRLHDSMRGTRGAAATICVLHDREIDVCAVGNVELRSPDARLPLVYSAGILGSRVNKFHICRATLTSKARLVLFSDGISSRTPIDDMRKLSPEAACDAIIRNYRRKEDDATVLVADTE